MASFRVHTVRFYDPEPLAIHCIAYSNHPRKIALSRSNSSIEIWDFKCTKLFPEKVIPPEQNRSIESLAWCQGRLFSVGLNGLIIEYDLLNLRPKNTIPTSFGACWCMAVNSDNTHLAVCTEEGYVSVFKVTDDSIEYENSLQKQEGRIMCLSWHKSGKYIATGSVDVIRVWNVELRLASQRMTVVREYSKRETIVWCVVFTSDFQIISGDSNGNVSIWDAEKGVLISCIQSHKADVLCLALDKNECGVWASGVDPQVILFERNLDISAKKWVKSNIRNHHTHDVRSMAMADEYLVSGGGDSHLVLSKYPPKVTLRFPPYALTPCMHLAAAANCILLQYSTYLELWRLGNTHEESNKDNAKLTLASSQVKLVELKAKLGEVIIASALSNDAKWIAYSTPAGLRIFQCQIENPGAEKPKVILVRMRLIPKDCHPACYLVFDPSGSKLLSLLPSGDLQVIGIDVLQLTMLHQFKASAVGSGSHILCVSSDGSYASVGNHDGEVIVFDINKYLIHCVLPKHRFQPTAISFDLNETQLIVAYQDQTVIGYDIHLQRYSTWTKNSGLQHAPTLKSSDFIIRGITFNPMNKDFIIFHDYATIYAINKKLLGDGSLAKDPSKLQRLASDILKVSPRYSNLLHFLSADKDFAVALEIPPSQLTLKLPPQLKQKKYGT